MENKRDKKLGLIVMAVLLAVLLLGGTWLYNALTGMVEPPESVVSVQESAAAAVTAVPVQADAAQTEATKPAEVAGPMPRANLAKNFTVYTDDGEAAQLIDLRGKPAVINFFASWCGPCKMEMPHFEEAYKTYGDTLAFMMVDLCAYGNDTKENAKKLIADGGWTFPVYFDTDGSATTAYAVRSMPTTIFVSADGELVGKQVGAMTQAQLQAQIDKLLAK